MLSRESSYSFDVDFEREVIWVEDLDTGGMSVTNNIEAVAENVRDSLEKQLHIIKGGLNPIPLIYRDSQGLWDGWHSQYGYIPIQTTDKTLAIAMIKQYFAKLN